jgi:hypothetical protein
MESDQAEVIDIFRKLKLDKGRASRSSKSTRGRSFGSYDSAMEAKLRGELPEEE